MAVVKNKMPQNTNIGRTILKGLYSGLLEPLNHGLSWTTAKAKKKIAASPSA
jgi:hypothetical protein